MVHSSSNSISVDVKPSNSNSNNNNHRQQQPIRRKRLSAEPRPHPAHCLNKRFWDELRAGRLPKTTTTQNSTNESVTKTTKEAKAKNECAASTSSSSSLSAGIIEVVANRAQSSSINPSPVPNPQHNQISSSSSSLPPPQSFYGIPSSSSSIVNRFPTFPFPSPQMHHPMPPAPFWGFVPAPNAAFLNNLPYPMAPHGFVPLAPPPYMMPYAMPTLAETRPDILSTQQPTLSSRSATRQQQNSESPIDVQETNNNDSSESINVDSMGQENVPTSSAQIPQASVPQIQFIPIPIPIPIPLTSDFVMKHFGK